MGQYVTRQVRASFFVFFLVLQSQKRTAEPHPSSALNYNLLNDIVYNKFIFYLSEGYIEIFENI